MPDINNILLFTFSSIILAFAPGPDNIFVLTQSLLNGYKAGLKITLGLCTGLIFHTLLVTFGIAAIFQTSKLAFNLLKSLGCIYLLYLSWLSFNSVKEKYSNNSEKIIVDSWQYYKRGIIMNITNPKVSIFFMAFLPQFANPEKNHLILQFITLGFIFIVITFIVFGIIISSFSLLFKNILNNSNKSSKFLKIVSGIIYFFLAINLILFK